MAVQFIFGRSGTGKTSYCINAIIDALLAGGREQLILLVPEQATYQAERAILAHKEISGYNRLNVLSFDRLQFLLLGKNTARPAVSQIGRQMIIHRILRDNEKKLKIFGSSATIPGLSRQMARTIDELHKYAKTPDDIEGLIDDLKKDDRNKLSILKFSDISLILKEYLEFIERDFFDPDVNLVETCRAVSGANFTKDAKLWIDGFAGFTEAEFAILTELLKVVKKAHVALCLDPLGIDLKNPVPESLDSADLFYPTQQTYVELFDRIKKCKLELAEPVVLKEAVRFSNNPQLAHIEQNLFNNGKQKIQSEQNVHIISAPNVRAEVKFVAMQIMQLVKEKQYRYRDIAVIAPDIDYYQHYIRAYFDDYVIPFFIDKRKPLNQHPIVQLICSAIQTVTGGFSNSDIFSYLKTDLVPIPCYDIDLLENYCIAFGISGGDWLSDKQWQFQGSDSEDFNEQSINNIRIKVIAPLLNLRNNFCPDDNSNGKISPEQFTKAIFDFLDELKVRDTVDRWIQQAKENQDSATIDRHQQFYNKLIDVFDELVEVFAGHTLSVEDFYSIVNSAFSQLTLAFIPPTLDQVLVGSIERSRHPDLKAVFLIGATQKQFPVPVSSDSILSDEDRKAAESAEFSLAATVERTLTERQYLAYIAFTRTSELLYISYPSIDEKASAVLRSQFIGELESLFENLVEEQIETGRINVEKIHNENELVDMLCEQLGKDAISPDINEKETLGNILNDICSNKQLADSGTKIYFAIDYDNQAALDKNIIDCFFEKKINSSATRLGTFSACPYRHFARYILELKKRKEFKFEPLDLGSFYHSALEALIKRINKEKRDFTAIDDSELLQFLSEEIEKIIKGHEFLSKFINRRGYNEFIITSARENLNDCVLALAQMIRAGSFRPKFSEISFGRAKDSSETIGRFELKLPDERVLSLNGKIDRLDFANIDNEKSAIVFDYKRKETSFSWSELCYGLDMQLPIYMLAVRNAADSETGNIVGAFYIPIEIPSSKTSNSGSSETSDSFNYKAKGIFNGKYFNHIDSTTGTGWSKIYNFRITAKDGQYGNYSISGALKPDDFEKVLDFTEKKIIETAQEVLSGKIDINPYRINQNSPCSYCEYLSVCRFDWQINDYNFLELKNKPDVLENSGGGG